jgi:Tfp pilus tip-associated adhesin PilY1
VYVGSGDGKVRAFDLSSGLSTLAVVRPNAAKLKPNRSLQISG